jgi:protein required for attachment to host cells
MAPPFIITADRGMIKAFKLKEAPNRGPMPQLVIEKEFREAHERYRDKVSDQAGTFPVLGSAGKGNAIAERHGIEREEDAKLFRAIGSEIERIIREHQPQIWSFAAPAEINSLILDHVPPDLRYALIKNVKQDLNKIPAESLLDHFR